MAKADDNDTLSGPRYWMTWVFAVGLVILFALACWILYRLADDAGVTETLWGRYVYVFGALEAIVFTAVGWIFGREVHRAQAEKASKDADGARREAKDAGEEAKREAIRGGALAEAVKASYLAADGAADAPHSYIAGGAATGPLAALRRTAEKLYPE